MDIPTSPPCPVQAPAHRHQHPWAAREHPHQQGVLACAAWTALPLPLHSGLLAPALAPQVCLVLVVIGSARPGFGRFAEVMDAGLVMVEGPAHQAPSTTGSILSASGSAS